MEPDNVVRKTFPTLHSAFDTKGYNLTHANTLTPVYRTSGMTKGADLLGRPPSMLA
jgi:hypothetical protein